MQQDQAAPQEKVGQGLRVTAGQAGTAHRQGGQAGKAGHPEMVTRVSQEPSSSGKPFTTRQVQVTQSKQHWGQGTDTDKR